MLSFHHHLRLFQLGNKNDLVLTQLFGWYSSLEIYHDVMDARERFAGRLLLDHKEYAGFQNP